MRIRQPTTRGSVVHALVGRRAQRLEARQYHAQRAVVTQTRRYSDFENNRLRQRDVLLGARNYERTRWDEIL